MAAADEGESLGNNRSVDESPVNSESDDDDDRESEKDPELLEEMNELGLDAGDPVQAPPPSDAVPVLKLVPDIDSNRPSPN